MHSWVLRLGGRVKVQLARLRRRPLSAEYVTSAPSPQHALDIFAGEWSSHLPAPPGTTLHAGALPLFADDRLAWALEAMGGVHGSSVLELGPLEGGHTWMLEQRGADTTAVEANRRAYLKCLVVKEVLGMTRARFLLGDALAYLRETPDRAFDAGIASGVLYHMRDPVMLLAHLARCCERLYLWTHYHDAGLVAGRPKVAARFGPPEPRTTEGFAHTLHPHWYQAARFHRAFCGSGETHPRWMERDDILSALRHFGCTRLSVAFDEPAHPHGPAFAVVALR